MNKVLFDRNGKQCRERYKFKNLDGSVNYDLILTFTKNGLFNKNKYFFPFRSNLEIVGQLLPKSFQGDRIIPLRTTFTLLLKRV